MYNSHLSSLGASKESLGKELCTILFLRNLFRSPDNCAQVKKKMVYASTKETLKKGLQGIAKEIQARIVFHIFLK